METVSHTRDYIEEIWNIAESIPIDADSKSQFIGAMLFSALNICDAMQLLIQRKNFVSVNVLLRSLFEYVFRAFWLNRVASEKEIEVAMLRDAWPKTIDLHNSIEDKNEFIDFLAKVKLENKDILHSYIHGGTQNPLGQLGNGNFITPNIPDSEILYLLKIIQVSAYLLLCESAHLSKEGDFLHEIDRIGDALIKLSKI